MKYILSIAITIYQKFISGLIHQLTGAKNACRFYPTCSEYAKIQIKKKGVMLGTYLSFVRILKCQPYYSKAV